jgi:hypothetical protein
MEYSGTRSTVHIVRSTRSSVVLGVVGIEDIVLYILQSVRMDGNCSRGRYMHPPRRLPVHSLVTYGCKDAFF